MNKYKTKNAIKIFLLLVSLSFQSQANSKSYDQDIVQLIQLVEYIGVDYSSAVSNNVIIDKGEYQEMTEFSHLINEKVNLVLANNKEIVQQSQSLQIAVAELQDSLQIKTLSMALKKDLSHFSSQLELPHSLITSTQVNKLFKNNCSSCHGETGKGDGLLAKDLQPAPTDFSDKSRANNRSIFGLYQAITNGLDGTAMPSFKHFTEKQRWSLAFRVAGIAYTNAEQQNANITSLNLQDFVMFSPNELIANNSVSAATINDMRNHPTKYFFNSSSALQVTRKQLLKSQKAYHSNNLVEAKTLAVSAYLDGFELIENALDAHNKPLRKQIEVKLMDLRRQLSQKDNTIQVDKSIDESMQWLNQAETLLTEASLSNTTIFTASFIILLREGLEALLVVLALFTILVRSEHKRGREYLHVGWVSALFAGFLTWYAAEYFIVISGASREIMEGVAALLAAVILLFVGFWMHSKSKAGQWQSYIKQNINHKLKAGSLWGIAGLSFITVYREVFETVLFYQSLILQTQSGQHVTLLSGFLFGLFILALIAWLVIKYSVKMPLAQFFSSTSYIILILAFILTGKAIAALQEAAVIPVTAFPINISFDWLGIYSTWQGLSAQLLVLIISVVLMLKHK
jgi:high-affinity iron transporter